MRCAHIVPSQVGSISLASGSPSPGTCTIDQLNGPPDSVLLFIYVVLLLYFVISFPIERFLGPKLLEARYKLSIIVEPDWMPALTLSAALNKGKIFIYSMSMRNTMGGPVRTQVRALVTESLKHVIPRTSCIFTSGCNLRINSFQRIRDMMHPAHGGETCEAHQSRYPLSMNCSRSQDLVTRHSDCSRFHWSNFTV